LASELTIGAAQDQAGRTLEGISQTSRLDAQLLLADLLGQSRSWVMAHPEFCLGGHESQAFAQALTRLAAGEPLAYILGWWEFFGRRFRLTPVVLIPRPETELLVELALELIRSAHRPNTVVDVGTGSGCVAVTLVAEVPELQVIATDISDQALEVAGDNARRHGVRSQLSFLQADLVEPLSGPLDLVLANLPYIPSESLRDLAVARHEPALALDGGADGFGPLQQLLEDLAGKLSPRGAAFLEIGDEQGAMAMTQALAIFPPASIRIVPDLAGRDRVLEVRLDRGG
jgi:release factor glutamine methyltransferase